MTKTMKEPAPSSHTERGRDMLVGMCYKDFSA